VTDKRALRAVARAARDSFVARPHPPIAVSPEFVAMLDGACVVASYVPIGSEADPSPLEQAALARGCRLALPHVIDRATPLRFLAWDRESPLTTGPFGLRQPAAHRDELTPDIVLTPLVAFDRALNRIGQGAGHYDRALAAFPLSRRIGIAWSVQEIIAITPDPWDAPLHAIATECEWITR
jgi:5-formyltetrahydrofolate cyclo-ligase